MKNPTGMIPRLRYLCAVVAAAAVVAVVVVVAAAADDVAVAVAAASLYAHPFPFVAGDETFSVVRFAVQ